MQDGPGQTVCQRLLSCLLQRVLFPACRTPNVGGLEFCNRCHQPEVPQNLGGHAGTDAEAWCPQIWGKMGKGHEGLLPSLKVRQSVRPGNSCKERLARWFYLPGPLWPKPSPLQGLSTTVEEEKSRQELLEPRSQFL